MNIEKKLKGKFDNFNPKSVFINSYKDIKEYNYDKALKRIKFFLYFTIILTIIPLLLFQIIQINITFNDENSNILFTLLNSLVIGVYLNIIGVLRNGMRNKYLKITILIGGIFLVFIGFTNFNFSITINLWFLSHKTFSTSTLDGVLFLIMPPFNFLIFSSIIWVSFIFESEPTNDGGML